MALVREVFEHGILGEENRVVDDSRDSTIGWFHYRARPTRSFAF